MGSQLPLHGGQPWLTCLWPQVALTKSVPGPPLNNSPWQLTNTPTNSGSLAQVQASCRNGGFGRFGNILDIGKALFFTFASNHRPSLGFDQLKTMTSGPRLWPFFHCCAQQPWIPELHTHALLHQQEVRQDKSTTAVSFWNFRGRWRFCQKERALACANSNYPFLELMLFFFWPCPHIMWDLSSRTWDGTCSPWVGSLASRPLDYQGSLNASLFDWPVSCELHPTKLVQAAHVHECIHVWCVCLHMCANHAPPGQEEPVFLGWLSVSTLA